MERIAMQQIVKEVSRYYKVPVSELRGKGRTANVALARHVAFFLFRELNGASWKQIGGYFGNRDHSTVMHGHRRVQMANHALHDDVNVILERLVRLGWDGTDRGDSIRRAASAGN